MGERCSGQAGRGAQPWDPGWSLGTLGPAINQSHARAWRVAEALETSEAAWLVTRIRADGRRTANEQALVEAVKAAKGEDALKSA